MSKPFYYKQNKTKHAKKIKFIRGNRLLKSLPNSEKLPLWVKLAVIS